jgi:hypothetical protein
MSTELVSKTEISYSSRICGYLSSARKAQEEADMKKFYSALSFAVNLMRENHCSEKYIRESNVDQFLALSGMAGVERVIFESEGSGIKLGLKNEENLAGNAQISNEKGI